VRRPGNLDRRRTPGHSHGWQLGASHERGRRDWLAVIQNIAKGKTMDVFFENYRNIKIVESIFGVLCSGSLLCLLLLIPTHRKKGK
jgi:hypothetical protein